jgi:hypothetical protein
MINFASYEHHRDFISRSQIFLTIYITAEYRRNKETIRSVLFDGPPVKVNIRSITKAKLIKQTDALVRITTAAICGSDNPPL